MVKSLLALISRSPWLLSSGLVCCVLFVIWFVSPHVVIAGTHPFQGMGIRLLLISVMVLVSLAKMMVDFLIKHRENAWAQVATNLICVKNYAKQFVSNFVGYARYRSNNIKHAWHRDCENRKLKKLPIYLVMGPHRSGKGTLLSNSGLRQLSSKQYGRQAEILVQQFDSFYWFFTDAALFIDIGHYQREQDNTQLLSLIRYLKKNCKAKPLSGVVLSFSILELILAKHEHRQLAIKDFTDQIKLLYKGLRTPIPVYTALTKCDLISGFTEFFSDLSKEELMQVWGISFPLKEASNVKNLQFIFDKEYPRLISRLQQRSLYALDICKNQVSRGLIFEFPQQMQIFRQPLYTFIAELFATLPQTDMLHLRGIYFTSAEQDGDPYDYLVHAVGRRFNLQPHQRSAQYQHKESYFIYHLFQDVMLSESSVLGFSIRAKRLKHFFYRLMWVVLPGVLVFGSWAVHYAYGNQEKMVFDINNALDNYHHAMNKLATDDESIVATLDSLNALRDAQRRAVRHSSSLLYASYSLVSNTHLALVRSLHQLYLPRIAANLEYLLIHRPLDTNTLYATLKGYLAFSPSQDTAGGAIVAPMRIQWASEFRVQPVILKDLNYYLDQSSHLNIDALPLNHPLINKIRFQLQQVVPSRRAYALLSVKSMAGDVPDLVFSSIVGQRFKSIFSIPSDADIVPALYTQKGYVNIFDKEYHGIARQVFKDNKAIGLPAQSGRSQSYDQIDEEMIHDYDSAYLASWKKSLDQIHVINISSMQQASDVFSLLGSDASPLTKMLNIIYDNTQLVSGDSLTVSKHYEAVNRFLENSMGRSSLAKLVASCQDLSAHFDQLSHSATINKDAFNFVKDYMSHSSNNSLRQLSIIADHSPMPIKRWLTELTDQAWSVLLSHAMMYIDRQWQHDVYQYYQLHVIGRYPVYLSGHRSLSINGFNEFFGVKGKLQKFFNAYLKYFIDSSTSHWKLKRINGHGLMVGSDTLHLFQSLVRIQDLYFDSESGQAKWDFSITPDQLDNQASFMQLTLGGQVLHYAHGPQKPMFLSWPFDINASQAKIIVSDFSSRRTVVSEYGPWSIFHLLQHGLIHVLGDQSGYRFSLVLGSHQLVWRIKTDAPIGVLTLSDFRHLHVPNKL